MDWHRRTTLAVVLALWAGTAAAQTSPGFQTGDVPTAARWNAIFAAKADFPLALTGDCAISGNNIVCTRTNGAPFAASATIDTTNAGTISTGTLNTARLPAPFTSGTRSGNTSAFVTTTGSLTSGNCVQIDANKNFIDAGAACSGAGGGITALTGDVTASGSGSVAATLATVNANTGSFGSGTAIPNFTVDAKGRITAAGSTALSAANIGTGTLAAARGGTGVSNSGTITLGASLTTTGAGSPTLAFPASPATYTFPASSAVIANLTTADQTLAGGANVTPVVLSDASQTLDCGQGPIQTIAKGSGAITLTKPSNAGSCIVEVTNSAGAGAVSLSGFSVGSNTGDTPDTTSGHVFSYFVWSNGTTAGYRVAAHQ